MAELNKLEIQSPELQEVMSEIPGSFLKWGLFVFFGITLILIFGSYLIKSPEKVIVPVVITTQNPPVALVAKSGGEVEKLFVSEGSFVTEGEVIGIIRNSATYEDIKTLENFLSDFGDKADWMEIVKVRMPPPDMSLGEIQNYYSGFLKEWKEMKDYMDQAYMPAKTALLDKQIEKKIEFNNELAKQEKYLIEDLSLSKSSFSRDSVLDKNSAISSNEFEKSRQVFIQKLNSYSIFNASHISNESDFLRLKENRLDLQVQYEKEIKQYVFTLDESLQLLRSSVSLWEERYLFRSPIHGNVTLTRFRKENQVIKAGEILATIIPDNSESVVARATIPTSGFGKVEVGQSVNIKLSGFPYMQYGVLKGRIFSVSQVPGEGGFIAEIELTGGMTSTYKEKIKFIHDMDGNAEIITRDIRLISRFLNPMRNALRN
jgi:hypothetical protein